MSEQTFDPTQFQAPHCNAEVLHAPGRCFFCDKYSDRQAQRAASGGGFTPDEANGWSGNTAAPAGQVHTHMGASYIPGKPGDGSVTCDSVHLGYQCEGRIREGQTKHNGFHHFGSLRWAPEGWTPPPVERRDNRLVRWLAGKMGF